MLKRFGQASLVLVLVLALAGVASATVANTSQKGSLLVFPFVTNVANETQAVATETYFLIGNDNSVETYVKCFWMDNNQTTQDFHFEITANQPIVFSTAQNDFGGTFGDSRVGALTCWAQNAGDSGQVNFNHLYGYAMVSDGTNVVFYNAYSFKAIAATASLTAGKLAFDNAQYEGCPKYLVTNFVPASTTSTGAVDLGGLNTFTTPPAIALWPCWQDLRQERQPTCTKAKFDIWNWDEKKLTGTYQCLKCYFEGFLADIGDPNAWISKRGPGVLGKQFTIDELGPNNGISQQFVARFRVTTSVSAGVCTKSPGTGVPSAGITCSAAQFNEGDYGFLGALMYGTAVQPTQNLPAGSGRPPGVAPVAGHTLHGAGTNYRGGILYDADSGTVPEVAQR